MKGQRNKLQGVHVLWAAVDRPKLLAEAHDDTCTHIMGCHTAGTYSIKIDLPRARPAGGTGPVQPPGRARGRSIMMPPEEDRSLRPLLVLDCDT